MLNEKKHIGHLIRAAMEEKGVGPTEVATAFGVKPPSVTGWITTGRIHKNKISQLVTYFGKPLEHWHFMDQGSQPYAKNRAADPPHTEPANVLPYIGKKLTPSPGQQLARDSDDWDDARKWLTVDERAEIIARAHANKRKFQEWRNNNDDT